MDMKDSGGGEMQWPPEFLNACQAEMAQLAHAPAEPLIGGQTGWVCDDNEDSDRQKQTRWLKHIGAPRAQRLLWVLGSWTRRQKLFAPPLHPPPRFPLGPFSLLVGIASLWPSLRSSALPLGFPYGKEATRSQDPRGNALYWTSGRPGHRPVVGRQLRPFLPGLPPSHLLQDQTVLSQMLPPWLTKPERSPFLLDSTPNAPPKGIRRGLCSLSSGRLSGVTSHSDTLVWTDLLCVLKLLLRRERRGTHDPPTTCDKCVNDDSMAPEETTQKPRTPPRHGNGILNPTRVPRTRTTMRVNYNEETTGPRPQQKRANAPRPAPP